MSLRAVRWAIIAVGATLVTLAIVAGAGSRTATLRKLVTEALADRLDSRIDLETFSVDTFPTVTVQGTGLVIRHRGRDDVPPLVKIDSFRVEGGMFGLLTRPRRFRLVTLTGLEINIPPGGIDTDGNSDANAETKPPRQSPFIIDTLIADNAALRIIPRKQGKDPKHFAIHRLEMKSLGLRERMPFKAQLTNPVPKGTIDTEGEFGPWQREDPGQTPLGGHYRFSNADLSTIDGIAGILSSTGEFSGQLEKISVKGQTTTPDFRLTISQQPVPLESRFQALVDGTNGDTYLNDIQATFRRTSLEARGAVTGTRGVKGRTVKLHVKIVEGRIEDLLRLAVKSEQPPMVGDVALHADFVLPPGPADVVDKLELDGEFNVDARFTDKDVQAKLTGMSRRARGEDTDNAATENVISGLKGRFQLKNGAIRFANLTFAVPGATVTLQGTYALKSEALMFDGTLQMQATISEAAGGGVKSFFLKIVDPLFRKGNAGAVVPITVRGTRSDPKFGVDVGRVFKPK